MADEEQKDVTIGVPAADAGADPVGEEPASPEPEDEEESGE